MLIRWSVLLPRLTVLVLLFGLVWMTKGEWVRQLVQFYIARQTGLSANIGLAQLEPLEGKIVLTNIQLEDRNGPSHDLCTIKKITAQAWVPDLLFRHLHLSEVRLEGIQTQVEVSEEGRFVPDPLWEKMKKNVSKEVKMVGELDWTTLFSESLDKIVLQLPEQKATPQAAIRTILPPKIDTQHLAEILIGPIVKEEWNKMQVWGDWTRSLLDPAETDAGTTLYEQLGLKPPKRFRGETIPLANREMRPELFIEKAHLNGQLLLGQTPVFFNGTVCNFAHPIAMGTEPIVAQFCFSGSGVPVSPFYTDNENIIAAQLPAVVDWSLFPNTYIQLSVDHKEENQRDTLIVTCPRYQISQRTLGDPKTFAIDVSPGIAGLGGVFVVRGELISGQIQIKQKNVRLTVRLPETLRNSPLQQILQQELDIFDEFTAEMLVEGTRAEPRYTFKTNIAYAIRHKMEALFTNEQQMLQQGVKEIQDTIPGLLKMLQGK